VPTRSRRSTHRHQTAAALPAFVQPQLSKLVKETPTGTEWLHEIKFDGYRMHARLDHGDVRLLTRTGRDWTKKYPRIEGAQIPSGIPGIPRPRAVWPAPGRHDLV